MNYEFPSARRAEKFPAIYMHEDSANEFIHWLREHGEIDRRVPPIYQDFRILHTANGCEYELFVHYNDASTAFAFRLRLDGKTLFTAESDYELYNGATVHVNCRTSAAKVEKYSENWLRETGLAAALLVIAVQAYMLYFKPDVVEKIYNPSATERHGSRRRSSVEPIRLRSSRVKRIYLAASDRPKREINYKALSWHVRGHYRRVGKEKKLKYIQPFTCSRGGKETKIKRAVYSVASPDGEKKI